jgi:hypothetical protein
MLERLKAFHKRYEAYAPAAFFIGGFLFDIVTLGRIDDPLSILQQSLYLVLLYQMLVYRSLEEAQLWSPTGWMTRIWPYQNDALHFVLGSLLSSYTLFYFVSASLATSFLFMLLMGAVLVANELPSLQRQNLAVKFGIFYLCLFSFFSYTIPILLRFVSFLTLSLAMLVTIGLTWLVRRRLLGLGVPVEFIQRAILRPGFAVVTVFLVLYFLKLLPPIPISVQYVGVYHSVEKVAGTYRLGYTRSFWKFWQNGDQDFVATPGDKIFIFARVFSPATIDDQVVFRWQQYLHDEWRTSDVVSIRIQGGRDEGFRAFAAKSNYTPGEWRVKIETPDGREMGRISFNIELADQGTVHEYRFHQQ